MNENNTQKAIPWALAAVAVALVVAFAVQSYRLDVAQQAYQDLRGSELATFDPLCHQHGMGFRYITNGHEIRCANETITIFYRINLKETHRIDAMTQRT